MAKIPHPETFRLGLRYIIRYFVADGTGLNQPFLHDFDLLIAAGYATHKIGCQRL